jgi:hypothetical protein
LRITDEAGVQTRYYGLDLTISSSAPAALAGAELEVALSGNLLCPGRASGVLRCFEIETTEPQSATVRFYFSELERNGAAVGSLQVYRLDGDWRALPEPYSRGGSGDALYVEAQNVALPGLFALDLAPGQPSSIYLPLMAR